MIGKKQLLGLALELRPWLIEPFASFANHYFSKKTTISLGPQSQIQNLYDAFRSNPHLVTYVERLNICDLDLKVCYLTTARQTVEAKREADERILASVLDLICKASKCHVLGLYASSPPYELQDSAEKFEWDLLVPQLGASLHSMITEGGCIRKISIFGAYDIPNFIFSTMHLEAITVVDSQTETSLVSYSRDTSPLKARPKEFTLMTLEIYSDDNPTLYFEMITMLDFSRIHTLTVNLDFCREEEPNDCVPSIIEACRFTLEHLRLFYSGAEKKGLKLDLTECSKLLKLSIAVDWGMVTLQDNRPKSYVALSSLTPSASLSCVTLSFVHASYHSMSEFETWCSKNLPILDESWSRSAWENLNRMEIDICDPLLQGKRAVPANAMPRMVERGIWDATSYYIAGLPLATMVKVRVESNEIAGASLQISTKWYSHLYGLPFLSLYPLLAYAYFIKYDTWLVSEEWTFLACVTVFAGHALSFLITKWNSGARAWITTNKANSLQEADCIRIIPQQHRGQGDIVPLLKRGQNDPNTWTFNYQRDTYTVSSSSDDSIMFTRLPYPSSSKPPLNTFSNPGKGLSLTKDIPRLQTLYGKNEFDIPIPTFSELFGEHATAPFFVFQVFCVALWCLDEYWYYSLFTLFMLVVFECTVVWQRVRTLTEFRTMSVKPYPIQTLRDGKWSLIQSDELLPGDVVSIVRLASGETTVPADILLIHGTCIVNEAMLSGESTPLLKESIQVLDSTGEGKEALDVDGAHKNAVLFSGTKVLQSGTSSAAELKSPIQTPDHGCLGVVLRTGFGTSQGQLVRTMIFSTERVSANNVESFLFIGFLLIFAIAASWYVWVKGIERDLKKSKLLLDCILIITSVVPPELPMELSLAVNASLVALSKYAIFCTEPFRIPYAGRVDVCCFDKTGTITAENLVLEGVVGVDAANPKQLVNVKETSRETTLCLAAAHALVKLDDGTIVGDPMEKTTLEALDWTLGKGDVVHATSAKNPHSTALTIRRRFQFSSALKRMSTISSLPNGRTVVAVKGAPETIKGMIKKGGLPAWYDDVYKGYTREGGRVLALGVREGEVMTNDKINKLPRDQVENDLTFAGFLVFHCPLKPDAVKALRMLADSSHRCVMITGDNPLTAVHVARAVEIVDRDALILDLRENPEHDADLTWRTVDESTVIPVNPTAPVDTSLFQKYDICITGAALKHYAAQPAALATLVQNTWVYARVSPSQKELILTTLKSLGYVTLMAGDGTNDVGALKQAHIGVALLDGTEEDLKKIAEHAQKERIKKVYETQLKISARFNQPPPPVPPAIADLYPDAVKAQQEAAKELAEKRQKNPMENFNLAAITDKMAEMEGEDEVPKIKLGDASCAAPFTSKLAHVSAVTHIIRQGRCTLVATVQMYKILALNCLITAYSLSVQYLDGIKFGDYQVTVTGMLMSVCFLCISRAKAVEKLSRERPLGNIFNFYVLLSVLLQFALHIVSLVYITNLTHSYEQRGVIDLEAKFEPNLLNTAIYLLGLSQQVSTFAINFQGRPFREGIRENPALWWGLVGAGAVAFCGATDFMPELNRWLQIVEMQSSFQLRLTSTMIIDFAGCWVIEKVCKHLFADLEPKEMITRGRERREARRQIQEAEEAKLAAAEAEKQAEKKEQ